jgi:hypothetical protein
MSDESILENPPRPDAIVVPADRAVGNRLVNRVGSIADITDPILGVAPNTEDRSLIRIQGGKMFVVKGTLASLKNNAPHDTLLFPRDHERAGQSRYRWVPQESGLEYGYLVEGAAL